MANFFEKYIEGRPVLLKILLVVAFFAVIIFSVRLGFSQVATNPPECTPPSAGAWIIPQGVTCNFTGETINVPGSTINPYYDGVHGLNMVVYGTLNVTNGIINLSDPTSAGAINTAKGGSLYLSGTQLNFGTTGVKLVQYDSGNPNPPPDLGTPSYITAANTSFYALEAYGGVINVSDANVSWLVNYGNSTQLTFTRVSMKDSSGMIIGGGTNTVLNSNINIIKTGQLGLTIPQSLTIKDSTVGNVSVNGATTADLTNVTATGSIMALGDSTTNINNSANLNRIYAWANSWLSNYAGYPTVNVTDSKAQYFTTNIGGSTVLNVDGLGTADNSYQLLSSKTIQSSNQPRFKITFNNSSISQYDFNAFGNSVMRVSNSNASIGELGDNADVTFTNSKVIQNSGYYSFVNGTPKVTSTATTWTGNPVIYTWTNPTLVFDNATIQKMGFLAVGSANVVLKGNVTIGPPNDATTMTVQWGPNARITREYPTYVGSSGNAVTIKNNNGNAVWSGTSGADKWAYPQIAFDNNSYSQKFGLEVTGSGGNQIDLWTNTPIQFAPPVLGTPCGVGDYGCGLYETSSTSQTCISSSDGLVKLCIPPGALKQNAYITISQVAPSEANIQIKGGKQVKKSFKIEVSGASVTFDIPAILTMTYDLTTQDQANSNAYNSWICTESPQTPGCWSNLNSTNTFLDPQKKTLQLVSQVSHLSYFALTQKDVTPPNTDVSFNCTFEQAPFNDWCKDNASVTLSATDTPALDKDSGVQTTKYSIDNNTYLTYTLPFLVNQKGVNSVYYYSVDNADNQESTKVSEVKVDKDSDGDGLYDNFDPCPADGRSVNGTGCPFSIKADDDIHVYYHETKKPGLSYNGYAFAESGKTFANHKYPLQLGLVGDSRGEEVTTATRKVYKYKDLLTATNTTGWDQIKNICPDIYNNAAITPLGTTAEKTGQEYTGVPVVDDYVAIKRVNIYDGANGLQSTNCKKVDSSSFNIDSNNDGVKDTAKRKLVFMKVVKPASIQLLPADDTLLTGSLLTITFPDVALWEEGVNNYVYPYIFASDSEWTVNVCLSVPTGYSIAGVYDANGNFVGTTNCSQTFVAGETKVMAFVVEKVGSPPKFKVEASLNAKRKGAWFGKSAKLFSDSQILPKDALKTKNR